MQVLVGYIYPLSKTIGGEPKRVPTFFQKKKMSPSGKTMESLVISTGLILNMHVKESQSHFRIGGDKYKQ